MDTTEFGKGIYFIAASLGWLPLVGMTLVAVAGMLRNKTQGIWVLAHRLSLVVVLLALVHAQMIGSEVKGGIWFFVHLLFASAVFVALIRRFVLLRT